jgi:ATP-binding cassette, subfamily F, member 3
LNIKIPISLKIKSTISHNELHLRSVATKLIIFDNDKITTYDGTYDEFLADVGWTDEDY